MSKKKKQLSEEELDLIHQEFSQKFADIIYDQAESLAHKYHQKYNYETSISTFNVLLSISANYAIELGIPMEDFVEVCKDFWKNANELLNSEDQEESSEDSQEDWLAPKTKNKGDLS